MFEIILPVLVVLGCMVALIAMIFAAGCAFMFIYILIATSDEGGGGTKPPGGEKVSGGALLPPEPLIADRSDPLRRCCFQTQNSWYYAWACLIHM